MRKSEKIRCLDMIETLLAAHEEVRRNLEYENEAGASELLLQCQQAAISLGEFIEDLEKAEAANDIVKSLEEYCEQVFWLHETVISPDENRVYNKIAYEVSIKLDKYLSVAKQKIVSVPEQIEVVFFPYKASMWDSLESVWRAADSDPNCNAYVIPIPYFDRKPDGSLGEMHYEVDKFKEGVPIVSYESYNLEERKPDVIFIHNPFDEGNHATSVHPFFYSRNLKQYTDHLVYIPYFISAITDERCEKDPFVVKGNIDNAATVHAHHIIEQSEAMAKACIDVMTSISGEETRSYWEKKFVGIGSPKVDKLLSVYKERAEIPDIWQDRLNSAKRVVLYNSGVMAMLSGDCRKWLEKTKNDLSFLAAEGITIIWRPHPLLQTTFEAMRPDLAEAYMGLVAWYKTNNIGIFDESSNVEIAIAISDFFTGDFSSIEVLCNIVGVPVIYDREELVKYIDDPMVSKKDINEEVEDRETIGKRIYKTICDSVNNTVVL